MLGESLPEFCLSTFFEGMRTHSNYSRTCCSGTRTAFLRVEEKVHPSLWPLHSAAVIDKQLLTAEPLLDLGENVVEANKFYSPIHWLMP